MRESLVPPPNDAVAPVPVLGSPGAPWLDGLSALDDAIGLLGDLQTRPGTRRRGRIDAAALLYELAPHATITLAADGGSEVFAEEDELLRMLQMLLADAGYGNNSSEAATEIHVERSGDEVHIAMELGPDAAPLDSLERRWLVRMATRLGGRIEMSGRRQALVLPADGATQEAELRALRRELADAQELGEAYARELASVLASAESQTTAPPFDSELWSDLLTLSTHLRRSLSRSGDEGSLVRQAVDTVCEFRAAEQNAAFDVAEALSSLPQRHSIDLHVLAGQRHFVGARAGVAALAELLALAALEMTRPGEAPSMTFAVREHELELSVTFVEPPGAELAARPESFAWYAAQALTRARAGRAGSSLEGAPTSRRVLFWARIPEHSPRLVGPEGR